jgi:hypothetical protein
MSCFLKNGNFISKDSSSTHIQVIFQGEIQIFFFQENFSILLKQIRLIEIFHFVETNERNQTCLVFLRVFVDPISDEALHCLLNIIVFLTIFPD